MVENIYWENFCSKEKLCVISISRFISMSLGINYKLGMRGIVLLVISVW